jgi:hypothetical protein
VFAFSINVFARNWTRVKIPGAVCGDGLPYSVFVDQKKNSKKLLIEFMGGGVCWSQETCWGKNFRTWIHPIPEVPAFSFMTSDFWAYSNHPFVDDSAIYFPYCTGDVFSADHEAEYGGVLPTYHKGYSNIVLAMQYLAQNRFIPFNKLERVTVWGASAGAIGALVHLQNIEPYLSATSKKIAMIDSAGLHFGPTFWHKFTEQLFSDFQTSFTSLGLPIDYNDGFLAPKMGPVFQSLSNWNIGIMQATRDEVMSNVFGDISPEEHQSLVLSDRGIASVAKNYSNVKTWISKSYMHTFLLLRSTSYVEDMEQRSALTFVEQVVNNATVLND